MTYKLGLDAKQIPIVGSKWEISRRGPLIVKSIDTAKILEWERIRGEVHLTCFKTVVTRC